MPYHDEEHVETIGQLREVLAKFDLECRLRLTQATDEYLASIDVYSPDGEYVESITVTGITKD